MTPKQFSAAMQRKAKAFETKVVAAEQASVDEAQRRFIQLSSGTISTAQLRIMGHPYARRAPDNSLDPEVINEQSGRFKGSWQKSDPRRYYGGIVSSVVNTDPNAKYMFGTRKMIQRPIDVAVHDWEQPRRMKRLQKAVRAALKA